MNGPALIRSKRVDASSAPAAFALSFAVTGLGQLYNGDPLKGFVFLALKILSLLALPVAALRGEGLSPAGFLAAAAVHAAAHLASAFQALADARRGKTADAWRHRTLRWFAPWTAAAIIAQALAYPAFFSFFSVSPVKFDGAPYCSQGDMALLRRFVPGGPVPGDLVLTDAGEPMRVIAVTGDRVEYRGGAFTRNDAGLVYGRIDDRLLSRMAGFDRGDIMTEKNGNSEYAIRYDRNAETMEVSVPGDSVLVSPDNRTGGRAPRILPLDKSAGKIEGIVFSRRLRRIGMPPLTAKHRASD